MGGSNYYLVISDLKGVEDAKKRLETLYSTCLNSSLYYAIQKDGIDHIQVKEQGRHQFVTKAISSFIFSGKIIFL
jgi:hypothetical protein